MLGLKFNKWELFSPTWMCVCVYQASIWWMYCACRDLRARYLGVYVRDELFWDGISR